MESSNYTINFEFLKDIDDPGYESMLLELHTKCCEVERAKMFSPENCLFCAGTACEAALIYYLKKTRGFAEKEFNANAELASRDFAPKRKPGEAPKENTFESMLTVRRVKRNFAHPEAGRYRSYEDTIKGDSRFTVDKAVDGRPSAEETEKALSDTFYIVSTIMRAVWPDLDIPAYGKLPSSADDYRHEIAVRTNRAMLSLGAEAFSAYEKANPYEPVKAEAAPPDAEFCVYRAPLYNKDKGLYELGLLASIAGNDAPRLKAGYRVGEDRVNGDRLLIKENALGKEIFALLSDRESGRIMAELPCGSFREEDIKLADQSFKEDSSDRELIARWPSAEEAADAEGGKEAPAEEKIPETRGAGASEAADGTQASAGEGPGSSAPDPAGLQNGIDEDYERFKAMRREREEKMAERAERREQWNEASPAEQYRMLKDREAGIFDEYPDEEYAEVRIGEILKKFKSIAVRLLCFFAFMGLIILFMWEGIGWKSIYTDGNRWLRVSKKAAAVDYDRYPYTGDSVPPWTLKGQTAEAKAGLVVGDPERLGDKLFSGGTNIERVYIPKSVKEIGSRAFEDCSSLTEVSLPRGLESVEDDAFKGCSSLEVVHYTGTAEEFALIKIGPGNEALLNARLDASK